MRSRALVYFGSLLATIALINTPVPRIVVSTVLNPEAGDAVARSLGSITKDLVLVLLVSIYFEWVRTREQGELLRGIDRKLDATGVVAVPAIRKLVLDATSPEELVTTALDRHMPRTEDKSSLVSLILSPRPAHYDVSVTARVEAVVGRVVDLSIKYELTVPRGPLLIAVTSLSTHSIALSDACPELFNVSTLDGSSAFEEDAKRFGEQIECYVETPRGKTERVEFRRVPTNAVRRHITLPVGITASDVALFFADISAVEEEFVRVRCQLRWSGDIDDHCLWWYADRPMFVRTLTMDLKEIVRDQSRKAYVQVFLGSVGSLVLDAENGYLSLRLDRWVVQGQGAIAIW
ncbi:hypothetical protein ACFWN2_20055 [Lentzea sp. NPDC058436]|uniref:hypothetical protein n=1 Tax=Lentzea sp. NPDC058436 TaxID=3346499 RepID=UPI00364C0115